MKLKVFLVILISQLLACTQTSYRTDVAFYFWKNNAWGLDTAEMNLLVETNAKKMYVKFFEVSKDEVFGAIPNVKTQLHISDFFYKAMGKDSIYKATIAQLNIVPTVYIRNDVFYNNIELNIDTLALNITFLIDKYFKKCIEVKANYNEIQIDCDWTPKTKEAYFSLLKAIKRESKKKLTCTLRLYPYKYRKTMGVPPVDRATLMCYNLISPLSNQNQNSVLDNSELVAYLKNTERYPVKLDVAFPVFSYVHLYQNGQFIRILNTKIEDFKSCIEPTDKKMWFKVVHDATLDEVF